MVSRQPTHQPARGQWAESVYLRKRFKDDAVRYQTWLPPKVRLQQAAQACGVSVCRATASCRSFLIPPAASSTHHRGRRRPACPSPLLIHIHPPRIGRFVAIRTRYRHGAWFCRTTYEPLEAEGESKVRHLSRLPRWNLHPPLPPTGFASKKTPESAGASCAAGSADRSRFTLGPGAGAIVAQARRARDFGVVTGSLPSCPGFRRGHCQHLCRGGTVEFPGSLTPAYLVPPLRRGRPRRCFYPSPAASPRLPFQGHHGRCRQAFSPRMGHAGRAEPPGRRWPTPSGQRSRKPRACGRVNATPSGSARHAILGNERTPSDDNAPHLLDVGAEPRDLVPPDEAVTVHDDGRLASALGVTHTTLRPACAGSQQLAGSGKTGMATDLGDDEQLCALAFIKRRFARCFA